MTRPNRKYGKLTVGADSVEYAPSSLVITGKGMIGNPTKEDYLANGWKEVIDEKLPQKEGFYVKLVGWTDNETQIIAKYEYVKIEKQPRHWTPLSIKRTVEKHPIPNEEGRTLWDALKDMLIEHNAFEDFTFAQYIAEDDELFVSAYSVACQKFGKDTIDAVIDEIPEE